MSIIIICYEYEGITMVEGYNKWEGEWGYKRRYLEVKRFEVYYMQIHEDTIKTHETLFRKGWRKEGE
jgi:hypothetical protein